MLRDDPDSVLQFVNELIISLFLGVRTLPTVIWPQVRHAVRPDIAAASTILLLLGVVPAGLAVLAWARLSTRRSFLARAGSDTAPGRARNG